MWKIGIIGKLYCNVIAPFFSLARYDGERWLERADGWEPQVSHTRFKWDSGDCATYEGPLQEHPTYGSNNFVGGAEHVFSTEDYNHHLGAKQKLVFAISTKQAITYLRAEENRLKPGSPYGDNQS